MGGNEKVSLELTPQLLYRLYPERITAPEGAHVCGCVGGTDSRQLGGNNTTLGSGISISFDAIEMNE